MPPPDEVQLAFDDENLFARDASGQLIPEEEATASDYDKEVIVTIDDDEVTVPLAVPTTDAQGNVIFLDATGRTKPRRTTIYDAALQLWKKKRMPRPANDSEAGEGEKLKAALEGLRTMVPTLCHRPHLPPVGVCRVCCVELARLDPDPDHPNDPTKRIRKPSGKLVAACVQPLSSDKKTQMVVNTFAGPYGGRVRQAVKVLLEMLAADHLPKQNGDRPVEPSELALLIEALGEKARQVDAKGGSNGSWLDTERLTPRQPWSLPLDDTSPLIRFDPNACILCDRCSRACDDVKENFVIGRTGKGYSARIGFDLNDPMGVSSCVECGECMLSCPTTALTFREPVEKSDWYLEQVGGENPVTGKRYPGVPGKSPVVPGDMDQNKLLGTLPPRYREWNQYSVVRWKLKAGEPLCRAGEYGATAFLLQSGVFEVVAPDKLIEIPCSEMMLGEMTCLNFQPRTSTVRAKTEAEVFEIRRNMLFALQRVPESRAILNSVYRWRAINNFISNSQWFDDITKEERKQARDYLMAAWTRPRKSPDGVIQRAQVELVRLEPDQVIFKQGDKADAFYMIRIGHVKVSHDELGIIRYLRPADEFGLRPSGPRASGAQQGYFGEIACLKTWSEAAHVFLPEDRDDKRTATCTALDHVELVRVDRDCFRRLLQEVPALKARVLEIAAKRDFAEREFAPVPPVRREFVEQGLYNAQRLLVLDLEACTRCDECTKACSDTHDGITRLIRDGQRIDKWLVASSCRSCSDPYCLVGCPVDAIHRDGKGKQIQIESHCIGCGLCANNCPYGNINMHPRPKGDELQHTATTCDLCSSIVGPANWRHVSCVFACPHNAAFRMTGDELWDKLEAKV